MSAIQIPQLGTLRREVILPLADFEWRAAENGRSDDYTLRGHAAVFNSLSENLGGFRELLEPGAFRSALRGTPDVFLLLNHDDNRVLARTTASVNGKPSLELREDATGLHVWARIQPRTWVDDLRIEMQAGLIDRMSFAFTLADEDADDWAVADDGTVVRTIRRDGISQLFDVSVVTRPAYTATTVDIRELRNAVESGRLPASVLGESALTGDSAPEEAAVNTPRSSAGGVNRQLETARRHARMRVGQTPTPKE